MHHFLPGLLEREALALSRQRTAQCQSEAIGLSMANVGQEGDEVAPSNEDALNMALTQSCEDYESQHLDLEEALAVSLQSLDEVVATKDSELAALQVIITHAYHYIIQFRFPNTHVYLAVLLSVCNKSI